MRKTFYLLIVVPLLLTLSCGGGGTSSGGGSGVDSTPVISNLAMSPSQFTLNQGGGAVTANLTFNFYDKGGDLATFTLFSYDQNGNTILKGPYPINGVTGQTSGTILAQMVIDTTTRRSGIGGIYVTDSGGRESNQLTGTITIS